MGTAVEEERQLKACHQFNMEKFRDSKPLARQAKAQTELELFHAKKALKDFQSLRGEEDHHSVELMQQLSGLKQELSKLKIDASSAVETKAKAERDIEFYSKKTSSCLRKMENLRKEIEEANEEHVLVELARIEAEKELREIESNRAAEAAEFSKSIEAANTRIGKLRREVIRTKELEEKLAATNTDVSVLQNEMELVRAMETNFHKEILEVSEKKSEEEEQEQLRVADDELSKAKMELESIKDEGFQIMASMDVIREELLLVSTETNRMQNAEKNTELTIGHLNSKLLKVRSKLESATLTEQRSREIVTNLSTALHQIQTEMEIVKEEKDRAMKETNDIKQEVEKAGVDMKSKEKKLQGTISKLGEVKASEFAALVELKRKMEEIVKKRALDSQNSAMIWVSNWEHEYLIKKGESAQAVADNKVVAINGWAEVLRAQEKEMLLKIERIEKENKAMRDAEEQVCNRKMAVVAQKTMEEGEDEFADMLNTDISANRKVMGEKSLSVRRRSSKVRRTSALSGIKSSVRSPSFTIQKKKRVTPNLGAILSAQSGSKKRNEVDIGSDASSLLLR